MTNIQNPPAAPLREQGGQSLADPERQKAYIAGVQRDLNRHLNVLGAPTRLAIDGVWDDATQAAFQDVCRVLGIAPERDVRTYRLIAGAVAALRPRKRSSSAVPTACVRGRVAGAVHARAGRQPRPAWSAARRCRPRTRSARSSRRCSGTSTPTCAACAPAPSCPSTASGTPTPSMRSSRCARSWGSRPSARRGRSGSSPARSLPAPRPSASARSKDGAKVADKLQHTGAAKVVVLAAARCRRTSATARTSRSCNATSTTTCCGSNRRTCSASTASGASTPSARSSGSAGARRRARARHADVPDRRRRARDPDRRRDQAREHGGVDYEKRLRELFAQQRRTLPQRPPIRAGQARAAEARQAAPAGGRRPDRSADPPPRRALEQRSSPRRGPRRSRSRCCARSSRPRPGSRTFRLGQCREPDQEPRPAVPEGHQAALPGVPAQPQEGARPAGRRPDAADHGLLPGPGRQARRLLEAGAEHHGRRAGAGGEDPRRRRRPAQRREGLQQLERSGRPLRRQARDAALPQWQERLGGSAGPAPERRRAC